MSTKPSRLIFLSAAFAASVLIGCSSGGPTSPNNQTGQSWTAVPSGTVMNIRAVWGSSAANVWAVGIDFGGAVQHYDGSTWSKVQTNKNTVLLKAVWGSSASDVWAVGDAQTIMHFNGTGWSSMPVPDDIPSYASESLNGVWGSSPTDVWAVGGLGAPVVGSIARIFHFSGTAWSAVPLDAGVDFYDLNSVWGSSASDVWAVGRAGRILHYDGDHWSIVPSGTTETLLSVWGSSGSDVWAAGWAGTILHFNGQVWSKVTSGTTSTLRAVSGGGASDVWIVGSKSDGSGETLHYNGTGWAPIPNPSTQILFGVWASTSAGGWAVGDLGTILHT
ncbi:MAG TPA: hypothetical protein VNC11_09415 [Gemmatimonadaceae bacterium]|nr:hypothetical protein [Gemmatimonadaceae bacterium]